MKRQRTEGDSLKRQRIARAIAAKLRSKYPYSSYGTGYFQRGTPDNISRFGTTFREASAEQKQHRRDLGYSGRGGYWGKKFGGMLGSKGAAMASAAMGVPELAPIANYLGETLGGNAGSFIEDTAAKQLSKWFGGGKYSRGYRGRGSYNEVDNQLIAGSSMSSANMSSVSGDSGDVIVTQREYVMDVINPATTGFNTVMFQPLNPGLAGFAPFLSQIAQFYDEYEFLQVIYEYKSLVTEGMTNSGAVIVATQYNPTNNAFSTKQSMENYDYAVSCKVTENMFHGVECDPSKRAGSAAEYIRTGAVPAGQDAKTFDLGVTQIAVSGAASAASGSVLGEVWVRYKVRLSKSKLIGSLSSPLNITLSGQTAMLQSSPFGNVATNAGVWNSVNSIYTGSGTKVVFDNTNDFYFIQTVSGSTAWYGSTLTTTLANNGFGVMFPAGITTGVFGVIVSGTVTTTPWSWGNAVMNNVVNLTVLNGPQSTGANTAGSRESLQFIVTLAQAPASAGTRSGFFITNATASLSDFRLTIFQLASNFSAASFIL